MFFVLSSILFLLVKNYETTEHQQCGKSMVPRLEKRILGGHVVDPPHSEPWLVRLGDYGRCSGTLISNRHVLTAAHCEMFVNPAEVTLGDHDAEIKEDGEMTMKVISQENHPQYWLEGDTAGYDFSIWTLEKEVQFSSTIQPVCLPDNSDENYLGQSVQNSGFGMALWKEGEKYPSMDWDNMVPRTVGIKVFPMSTCLASEWLISRLENVKTPGRYLNDTNTICAGINPNDVVDEWIGPNKGDSGGI